MLGRPIYLAISGKIIDVTSGGEYYAPGSHYNVFAGRACSRALSLSSLKPEDNNDFTADFDERQKVLLVERFDFYVEKYGIVGMLSDYSPDEK